MRFVNIFLKTSLFVFFLIFTSFIFASSASAGDGSVTSVTLRRDFGEPSCYNTGVGIDVQPRNGAGTKTFYFSSAANSSGWCQVTISGKGKVCGGSTNISGTIGPLQTYTYTFTTCAEGGNFTNWGITADIYVTAGSPPPPPPPPPAPPLSISCSGSPNPVNTGQQVQWNVSMSGGSTPYTITWSGDVSGSGENVFTSYASPGTKTASVTVNEGFGTSKSTSCSINVNSLPPDPPTAYAAPNCSGVTPYVTVSWSFPSSPTPIQEYQVEKNGDTPFSTGFYNDYSVGNNLVYQYRVRARNSAGWSNWSDWVAVTTNNCAPPIIIRTIPECSGISPYVNLDVFTPANTFNIGQMQLSRSDTGVIWTGSWAPGAGGTYTWGTDWSVKNNGNYSYAVRQWSGVNNQWSPWSNWAAVITKNCAPPTLTVVENSCNGTVPKVVLSWGAPNNARNMWYRLFLISKSSPITDQSLAPNSAINFYLTSTLTLASSTYYSVISSSSPGEPAGPDASVGFTTQECDKPQPFNSGVSVDCGSPPRDGLPRIIISFSPSTFADQYYVYGESRDNGGSWVRYMNPAIYPLSSLNYNPGTGRYFLELPGRAKSEYTYLVRAVKSSTGSFTDSSNGWTQTPQAPYCDFTKPVISLQSIIGDCIDEFKWDVSPIQPIRVSVTDDPQTSSSGINRLLMTLTNTDTSASRVFNATPQPVPPIYGYFFSRSDINNLGGPNYNYRLTAQAFDNAGNASDVVSVGKFFYSISCTAWLQTRGSGAVHTENDINTPGGPRR